MRYALVLALGVGLAGCGGSSVDPVALAAARTQNVATARFTTDMSIRDPKQGSLDIRGAGVISAHGRVMSMQMTMPAREVGASGKGDVNFQMIGTDDAFYYRGAPFRALLQPGKRWVEIRSQTADLGQNDPGSMLAYLRATSQLHRVGPELINGVETTHYSVKTQIQKALQRATPADRKRLENSVKQLTAAGIREVPFDVWIDDQGFIRRLVMDWRLAGGSIAARMDFSDFGAAPSVTVPSQSQVVDITSLAHAGSLP